MASDAVERDRRAGGPARTAPTWRPTRRALTVLAVAYWAYVVNGVVNSEVGPALLGIVHTFHIDLAAAGAIFTAQFIGYLPGALGSGAAVERWGYRRVLICAALLTAAGTAGTALAGMWPLVIALTLVGGFGFGVTDSLCNAVVAAEAPREGGAALNLLHTFFGVGALLGPLLIAILLTTPAGWQGVFLLTGALACSCAVLFALAPMRPPSPLAAANDAGRAPVASGPAVSAGRSPWRDGRLWLLMGLLFLFVGMEQLCGGWATTYLNRSLGAHLDVAARSVSLYWAAVTVGRALASAVALRLSNERLLGGSAVLSLAAIVALALVGAVGPALLALTALGLGFAPIYPTIVAIAARVYVRRFATIAGLLVAAGGLGGTIFPWVGGVVGQVWGLRATIWLGAGIATAFLALFAVLQGQHKADEGR